MKVNSSAESALQAKPAIRLKQLVANWACSLVIFTLFFASASGRAQLTYGDWRYSVNGNNAIITRYTGTASDLSIPSTINGLPVQFIDIAAFSGNTSLTNVLIPISVSGVLNGAAAVPFASCINLLSITVDPQNSVFSSVDGVLFNKKQTSLIEYPLGRLGAYSVPAGVVLIASYAFYECTNLTSVTIPNTVTNIRPYSFHSCSSLRFVTIPASVQAVGDYAFNGCDYLTNIIFTGNAPLSGVFVFSPEWVMLPKTVYYVPGSAGWGSTYAGYPTAPLTLSASVPTVRDGQFSFSVAGPSGISAVIESCTSLDRATWSPIQIGTLSGGSLQVTDTDWANHPMRFYRVRLE